MKIDAEVHTIEDLKPYFFLVPDYQREYVWQADDHVEQFLNDVNAEFDPDPRLQQSYFVGSIILVKNGDKHDVIDGQQRLTTLVLTLCALRDRLLALDQAGQLDVDQQHQLKGMAEWLSSYSSKARQVRVRLELQYSESKDYLSQRIAGTRSSKTSPSIERMEAAYERIHQHLDVHERASLAQLCEFARYVFTQIELVVIETESIGSALKIFETINQRGVGLNAMDLVKNLLFSQADEGDFQAIKAHWKALGEHLKTAKEDEKPLRFLRYFLTARYHHGVLREDDVYKWVISAEGRRALNYANEPVALAQALELAAKRYAELVVATGLAKDGGAYPAVTRIGYINKHPSRLHLVLLLALHEDAPPAAISYLAEQIESFFFFSNALNIQTKYHEPLFSQWAQALRGLREVDAIAAVLAKTMLPNLQAKLGDFRQRFAQLRHTDWGPLYRQRFVLGRLENRLRELANLQPALGVEQMDSLQIEHILVQTPKGGHVPTELAPDAQAYQALVKLLGNTTLLEATINQAVNQFNDLGGSWFADKQREYANSSVLGTQLLNHQFAIGQNTRVNAAKAQLGFDFAQWDAQAIAKRQAILLELALDTWRLNGQRLDQLP
jgi:hypothetical protein